MSISVQINGSSTSQLHRKQFPIEPMPFTLPIEQTDQQVTCHDDFLSVEKQRLQEFFLFYLDQKPLVIIHVSGSHPETRTRHVQVRDAQGNVTGTRAETYEEWVVDWSATVDMSIYVSSTWETMDFGDVQSAGRFSTIADTYDWFNASAQAMKEIKFDKRVVGFNHDRVQQRLMDLARSTGYTHRINAHMEMKRNIVAARSSSALGKMFRSCGFWLVMVLTFMWVLMVPVYCFMKRGAQVTLAAFYRVNATDDRLVDEMSGYVRDAATNKKTVSGALQASSIVQSAPA